MRLAPIAALALLFAASSAMAQQNRQFTGPPSADVRLTFHLIEANGFQEDDAAIRPIVIELRKVFRFEGYRLLSTSVLNAVANPGSSVSQRVADDQDRTYRIFADVGYDGSDVRINVSLALMPSEMTLIDASVSLQEGKTVVLGSARVDGQSAALILAVTPSINPE